MKFLKALVCTCFEYWLESQAVIKNNMNIWSKWFIKYIKKDGIRIISLRGHIHDPSAARTMNGKSRDEKNAVTWRDGSQLRMTQMLHEVIFNNFNRDGKARCEFKQPLLFFPQIATGLGFFFSHLHLRLISVDHNWKSHTMNRAFNNGKPSVV